MIVHNKFFRYISCICISILLSTLIIVPKAEEPSSKKVNESSGYDYFIQDEANLFNRNEEAVLTNILYEISEFGHAGVITLDDDPSGNTERYAYDYMMEHYRYKNAVLLIIDMDCRLITVWGNGDIQQRVQQYSTTITDNIYEYASDGNYFECAKEGLDEINAVLKGLKIAQPMKYLSNACLAIILALLIGYVVARRTSQAAKVSNAETQKSLFSKFTFKDPKAIYTGSTKEYSPVQSSSGGSSGGGGSGGGGGGGGGGGSHGF